jgi:predicted nucleotidyltransferase
MTKLKEVKKVLEDHRTELKTKFKVKKIGVFGSYVRGEQDSKSDIDILVDFDKDGIGYFAFCDLEDYLKKLLKIRKVDLTTRGALKPLIGKHILNEVEFV